MSLNDNNIEESLAGGQVTITNGDGGLIGTATTDNLGYAYFMVMNLERATVLQCLVQASTSRLPPLQKCYLTRCFESP